MEISILRTQRHHLKEEMMTSTITPFLWFDDQAEEAMNFYLSVFKDSEELGISRYGDAGPGPVGSVMVASFRLNGHAFHALNAGPHFQFTEAVSFYIECETQDDVDYYWNALTADGGEESQCGWLKDKFGLSWQVVPRIMRELQQGDDAEKTNRAMQAMFNMTKFDIATIEAAAEQQ
jgi:predicted 3-demethylubiquinone-9 3-methyltransferase (glyoxalase superfamily)